MYDSWMPSYCIVPAVLSLHNYLLSKLKIHCALEDAESIKYCIKDIILPVITDRKVKKIK